MLFTAFIISPFFRDNLDKKLRLNKIKKIILCLLIWIISSSLATLEKQIVQQVASTHLNEKELLLLSPFERAQTVLGPVLQESLKNNRDKNHNEIKVSWSNYTDGTVVEVQ